MSIVLTDSTDANATSLPVINVKRATSFTSRNEENTADAAFKRVKPVLDNLNVNIKEARRVVGREYRALDDGQKKNFRKKISTQYGWSDDRVVAFARIEKKIESKKKIIQGGGARITPLDELSTRTLTAICDTPDETLATATRAGLFKKPVTSEDIKRFRKTGQLPQPKTKRIAKTDLDKIRAAMVVAESHIRKASLKIGEITSIMYDADISEAKGREATALVKSFEKLCTKMATANPATSRRAFAILRGEE